jgi:hypothetical protein
VVNYGCTSVRRLVLVLLFACIAWCFGWVGRDEVMNSTEWTFFVLFEFIAFLRSRELTSLHVFDGTCSDYLIDLC